MIVHVAAAGEARGRVVLQLGSGEPNVLALQAAVQVARAFNSEIESLFIESQQLLQLASYPFAREISLTGRSSRSICSADIEQDLRLASQAVHRQLDALAQAADVPLSQRVVRAEPIEAVAQACAECGPWNVVALGYALGGQTLSMLADLFASVTDATGVVAVGPKVRRATGPVIVAIEDAMRLPAMLATAERLAPLCAAVEGPGEIVALLVGDDVDQLVLLEGHVRLSLGERENVRVQLLDARMGSSGVIAETLRRLQGGFIIAAHGGLTIPDGPDFALLASVVECPMFLVK